MTTELVLLQKGQPIDLNEHPSLLAALHASSRAIVTIRDEIKRLETEREELTERIDLLTSMGMPAQGPRSRRTRLGNRIKELEKRMAAHQNHYLEVPDMGGDSLAMDDDFGWHQRSLPTETPIDVLRALKHAHDSGLFDEFRLYTPADTHTDPMIVGLVGGACFYIGSWR